MDERRPFYDSFASTRYQLLKRDLRMEKSGPVVDASSESGLTRIKMEDEPGGFLVGGKKS